MSFFNFSDRKKVDALESIGTFTADLALCISNAEDVFTILSALRKRLHNNPNGALEAAKTNLLKYAYTSIRGISPEDKRVPVAIDVVNEILHQPDARRIIIQEEQGLKNLIDDMLSITKDMISTSNICFEQDSGVIRELDDDESLESFIHEEDSKRKAGMGEDSCFLTYGYKAIISIGLICSDSASVQTLVADRGGVEVVIMCLKSQYKIKMFAVWCIWTAINIVLQHPPNKREFYMHGVLPMALAALKYHALEKDVYEQGLALVYCLLVNDPSRKYNITNARTQALANGLIDVLQHAKKQFKTSKEILMTTKAIEDEILKDWS